MKCLCSFCTNTVQLFTTLASYSAEIVKLENEKRRFLRACDFVIITFKKFRLYILLMPSNCCLNMQSLKISES